MVNRSTIVLLVHNVIRPIFGQWEGLYSCHDEFYTGCRWSGDKAKCHSHICYYDEILNALEAMDTYTKEYTIVKTDVADADYKFRVDIGDTSVYGSLLSHAICDCIIRHNENIFNSRLKKLG